MSVTPGVSSTHSDINRSNQFQPFHCHTGLRTSTRQKTQQQIQTLSALMASFLLLLFSLCAAASGQHVMTVQPGDDTTLRCEAGDVSILVVEWSRPDLEPQYVLLCRDGHLDTYQQHQSFTGRVELVHRELKDGDVSLTLKNVTSRDSGTYECRVRSGGSRRTKRAIIDGDPIEVIYLEVTDAEKEKYMGGKFRSGNVGLAAERGVVAEHLLIAVVFVVWI